MAMPNGGVSSSSTWYTDTPVGRGTRAGHQYQLLGHTPHGALAVEPYLITLAEQSDVFPIFQHAGLEFLYMLEGEFLATQFYAEVDGHPEDANLKRALWDWQRSRGLPLTTADAVFVSLGENFVRSILCSLHVKDLGARRILATHGNCDALVRLLCERGVDAAALRTEYGEEN